MAKLTMILILLGLLQISAGSYSQTAKLSLKMNDVSIADVFNEIEKISKYRFFYDNDLVDKSKLVSVVAEGESISSILDKIFLNIELDYEIMDLFVLVKSANGEVSRKETDLFMQQPRIVSGKVTDYGGQPLPGLSIVVKGTTQGTVTNLDGEYTITNLPDDATLIFSFIGMKTQEVVIDAQTIIDVTMEQDVIGIEEVVSYGYGVAKKSDLTGSITQIKAENMKKYSPSHINDLLRTNVPGLSVGYSTSAKDESSLLIRGHTTLTAGTSPLIVLDGVIFNGDLSDINPDDINTIDILKDASSTAVYGSRAANGVISITTKKGTGEKPTINVSSTLGLATDANRERPYDPEGIIQWRSDMFKSIYRATIQQESWSPFDDPRTLDPQYLDQWLEYHSTTEDYMVNAWLSSINFSDIEIRNYKAGNILDWEDKLFRNGIRQDYNVSLSGKNKDFSYYYSLGYMKNEALARGDDFSTIRSRVNIEGQVATFLKVGLNAHFSYRDESSIPVSTDNWNELTPYSSYYEDDSDVLRLYPNDLVHSPHPMLNITYMDRERKYFTLSPKIYSVLDLPYGITYTMNFTTRMDFHHNFVHSSSEHPTWGLFGGSASRDNEFVSEWQIDNIINWSHTFNLHKFDVTLLANAEKFKRYSSEMDNRDFQPNDVLGYHDMSIGSLPEISSYDEVQSADALMARINYNYNSKYLITLSYRRDGSSLFGYSNPWATFPSAALGWVLTEEDFFKVNFINYLKIRASWGENGNRDIANYAALSKIAYAKSLNGDQAGVAFTIPTLAISTMENKNLKWERTKAFNLGIDFNVFNGTLSGSMEAYEASTYDVLVNRELPTITGFQRVYANLGKVKNKGLEISLNSINVKRSNFEWRSNLNFALNRNKIVSITGEKSNVFDKDGNIIGQTEADDITNNWFIGQAKDVLWDYRILGTWKVGEETEAAKWSQVPGDFRLQDVNDDGLLTNDDKQFLGYRHPRFTWTLSNNFSIYKNIEVSFVLYSLWGMKGKFNTAKHDDHTIDRGNTWDVPYWTPDNQIDEYARLRSSPAQGVKYNAWFDQSHIRLENVAIAYSMPKKILNRAFIDNMRITFNIKNAALWAPNWEFGDPENGTSVQRIFSLGLNFTI